MAPMIVWSQSHPGQRLGICESGTVESTSDPRAKSRWLSNAEIDLQSDTYERLEFAIYWSSGDFRLDTSANSLTAARAWFSDPYWIS